MPARWRKGRARLRDYGGLRNGRAVIVVPSLINPPTILDLTSETSLLRWLVLRGHRVLLLDWGEPNPAERDMDTAQHVERILLPLIAQFDPPPVLVGYCLGGTLALATAARATLAGLALIATPWHFSGFGPAARASIADLWASAKPTSEALGLVPMEVLQAGFWRLDPAKTVAKYEAFARLAPDSDAARLFVAMEDWANAGAPLPYATGRELFEDFIGADLPGRSAWRVTGAPVSLDKVTCPAIDFVSRNDRIVPAASAASLSERRDLAAGHVGMIVGRGARTQLWEPLDHWLSTLPSLK